MINGVTFEKQLITSANMAHFMWTFGGKKSGITAGCEVTTSGNNIYISPGYILAHGRMTQIVGTETITVPAVTSGSLYSRLVYRVDLTRENTETEFTQGYFEVLQSATGYPTITREDLDNGGNIYDVPIARFTVSSSGISGFAVETVSFDTSTEVSLPVNGWSASGGLYTQTVNVDTVAASSKPTQGIIYPAGVNDTTRKAIQKAAGAIVGIETADGTVTFTATRRPAVNLTIALML